MVKILLQNNYLKLSHFRYNTILDFFRLKVLSVAKSLRPIIRYTLLKIL